MEMIHTIGANFSGEHPKMINARILLQPCQLISNMPSGKKGDMMGNAQSRA